MRWALFLQPLQARRGSFNPSGPIRAGCTEDVHKHSLCAAAKQVALKTPLFSRFIQETRHATAPQLAKHK
jgi:hypothetical protein